MSDNIGKGIEAVEAIAIIAVIGIGGYLAYKAYQCIKDPVQCFKTGVDNAEKFIEGAAEEGIDALIDLGKSKPVQEFGEKTGLKDVGENFSDNMNKGLCLIGSSYGDNCNAEENKPTLEKSVIGVIMKEFGYKFAKPRFSGNAKDEAEINSEPTFIEACNNYDPPGEICKKNGIIYCSVKDNKYFSMDLSNPKKSYPPQYGSPCREMSLRSFKSDCKKKNWSLCNLKSKYYCYDPNSSNYSYIDINNLDAGIKDLTGKPPCVPKPPAKNPIQPNPQTDAWWVTS